MTATTTTKATQAATSARTSTATVPRPLPHPMAQARVALQAFLDGRFGDGAPASPPHIGSALRPAVAAMAAAALDGFAVTSEAGGGGGGPGAIPSPGGDPEHPPPTALGIAHDVRDEGVVARLGEGQFDESALARGEIEDL